MAFPQDPLDVTVELQLDGTWTDITDDVYLRDKISITRGRADEGSRPDPGRCTLTLNNRSGTYSPRNPVSPHYGILGRNTPVRVSVPHGDSYLAVSTEGDRATTPDAAALDITGDIDIRIEATLDNWQTDEPTALAGKYGSSGQQSWLLYVTRDGRPILQWTADGSTVNIASSEDAPVAIGGHLAVRCTVDVNNGAGGHVVTFYSSDSISGPWTSLGGLTGSGTTSFFASTAALEVGDVTSVTINAPSGGIHALQLRSGIDGTIVANPDFTAQAPGTTSFVDSAGRTWSTAGSASITNRLVRFVGEISSWPPRWDVSGEDVWTPVEAAGITRRLGQGVSPLASALRRSIPAAEPVAYWPLEDERSATQAASAISGGIPLAASGLTFANVDTLDGSSTAASIGSTASISGTVTGATAGEWRVEFATLVESAPTAGSDQTLMAWSTSGTAVSWRLGIDATALRITARNSSGTLLVNSTLSGAFISGLFGDWVRIYVTAETSGGNVDWELAWQVLDGSTTFSTGSNYPGTVGAVTGVSTTFGTGLGDAALAHLAVFEAVFYTVGGFELVMDGNTGEHAGYRFLRLCSEESIQPELVGWFDRSTTMGPQRPNTLLDLLDEVADVEQGIVYEQRRQLGLKMRDRQTLYNQDATLVLDYEADGEVSPPLEPTDDDQATRNDRTVQRANGSSARAVLEEGALSVLPPPDGVGRYDDKVTLNLELDEQCAPIAAWRLHVGTWDEPRYPQVHVDLAAGQHLIEAATTVDIGDRITITSPPAWLPPDDIDQLVQGYTETIGLYDWDIVYNCAPAGPYRVAVLDDNTLSRLDTAGSELASSVTSTASAFSISTTSGPTWTTDISQYPLDLRVGGEVVTADTIGTLLTTNPFVAADLTGWTAQNGSVARSTAVVNSDHDAVASILITPNGSSASGGVIDGMTAVGTISPGAQYIVSMWAYSPGGWSDLRPAVDWADAAGNFLASGLGSGTAVSAGVWTYIQQTLTAPASASRATVRGRHGGTPPASAIWYAWAIRLVPTSSITSTSPQAMTVTRSVNGVVKPHVAGADVRVAQPMILAL